MEVQVVAADLGYAVVQVEPLRVNPVGDAVLPLWSAWKPMETLAPDARAAL
jgi:hypothetical protein